MTRVAVLVALVLAVAVVVAVVSFRSGEDRAAIASEVANEWVEENIDAVSDAMVEVLTLAPALGGLLENVPSAKTLLAGAVADQVRDKIDWTFSTPSPQDDVTYRVTATAGLDIEIDPPILSALTYTATLPFHLLIDTVRDARNPTVQDTTIDFAGAAAGGARRNDRPVTPAAVRRQQR